MELMKIDVMDTYAGTRRQATFKDLNTGREVVMDFGTFLATPANKKRGLYENNDITDEHVLLHFVNIIIGTSISQSIFASTCQIP